MGTTLLLYGVKFEGWDTSIRWDTCSVGKHTSFEKGWWLIQRGWIGESSRWLADELRLGNFKFNFWQIYAKICHSNRVIYD